MTGDGEDCRVTAIVICTAQQVMVGRHIKTYLKEMERSGVDLIYMARDKDKRQAGVFCEM